MEIKNLKLKISAQGGSASGGQNSAGFTLIETLVSIFVLTLAFTGPLSLASYTIRSSSVSQNQFSAFFLAQEAIEYIKNRRDNNTLVGAADWLEGLGPCRGVNGCVVDITNNNITNCPGPGCPKLKYDSANGLYNQTTGTDTVFTREVKISDIETYEAKITATVSWQERSYSKSFVFEEHIFAVSALVE